MFNGSAVQDYILSGREKMVILPDDIRFDGANFSQSRDDLIITASSGYRVFVRGFFTQSEYPVLMCGAGELMAGELAAAFIRLSPCAMSALMDIDRSQDEQADTAS